ncbi:flagellar biosynthesis protein FlhA [Vibrio owensii]|uniref:flagellar biosynthesis protein FlhA n=1 Tax=Vibrio owensii TaxID=696485 RepID=UPI0018F10F8B|nr:flagellar biosynthesis protein FlhA [Vibrio owensii]
MPSIKNIASSKLMIPLFLLAILGMIILPLPPFLLDGLFIFNIALAILILLKSTTTTSVLQFSVFPTLLLVATLMRLSLNVASTRVVLIEGHNGADAAGKVIQAFGEVVIGGSYVVGIIVFAIIMIINFMVITKGGERISEVSARFTLDALPGKQMAIDADLNAGLISQEEAKERRKQISEEAEFHGAMDGASKFVKGDAIAGMLILAINLIGGIMLGVFEHGIDGSTAFKTYGLLTIGDGLIAQIPSLLLATASAILVTRINDNDRNIAQTVDVQLTNEAQLLYMGAGVIFILGSIPGMPHFAFYTFAFGIGALAWFKQKRVIKDNPLPEAVTEKLETSGKNQTLDWGVIPRVEAITLTLGLRIVPFATTKKKNSLVKSILGVRKTLSEKAGFLIPEVTIRDDLSLKSNQYGVKIDGDLIELGEVHPDHLMAVGIPPGDKSIDGIISVDPAYKQPALWIEPTEKPRALGLGYQVIDVHDVIATHVSKISSEHLSRIFNFDDVKSMNQRLKMVHPELGETLESSITANLQMMVMRQLLSDQVPIINSRLIANTIIETVETTKDPILIAEAVRVALARTIMNLVSPYSKTVPVFTIKDDTSNEIAELIRQAKSVDPNIPLDSIPLTTELMEAFKGIFPVAVQTAASKGHPPIILTAPMIRPVLSKIAKTFAKEIIVLSYSEIPTDYQVHKVSDI